MSEEKKQNEGGNRRYFRRRRRRGKKGGKRNDQGSNQPPQPNAQNDQTQEGRKGSRRKKRRSRRNRPDRRQRQPEPQMPEAIQVPETENYVEPTDVYVYTHIVRPSYRDAYPDYRPEPQFSNVGEERVHASAMDGLRSEIHKQLDEWFGPAPEEEEDRDE